MCCDAERVSVILYWNVTSALSTRRPIPRHVLGRPMRSFTTCINSLLGPWPRFSVPTMIFRTCSQAMAAPKWMPSCFSFPRVGVLHAYQVFRGLTLADTLPVDIECMRKLSEWTNVIPVISKSDLLTPERLSALKSSFHSKVHDAAFNPFLFGDVTAGDSDEVNGRSPFAASSAKSSDNDVMDASTLMSPDYVQPLVASELALLTQKLFDRENMAWIRHLTAKKLAQRQDTLQSGPLSFVPGPGGRAIPNYTMSRISDYTCHEEKMAQVQLARWASDLQQSIQNERERYARIARGERAVWLTERLGECVVDGSLVPIAQTPGFCGLRAPTEKTGALLVRAQAGQNVEYHLTRISPQDPLGLVRWSESFKQRGWALVQIVGSFGVVGGLALWLAKSWGLPSRNLSDWQLD